MPDTLPDFLVPTARLAERVAEPGTRVQREHTATPPTAMSGARLGRCLIVIGWAERELARRTGRHQTQIRRWLKGASPIPQDVAAWIEALAAFIAAHPGPRLAGLSRLADR